MEATIKNVESYKGKEFLILSTIGDVTGLSIETVITEKGQMLFSRKINYSYLLKNETNVKNIHSRLAVILENQHHDVIRNIKQGKYDNLIHFTHESNEEKKLLLLENIQEESENDPPVLKEEVINRISHVIDSLQRDLGEDLLLAYLWTSSGDSLTGYSASDEAMDIFKEISGKLKVSLKATGYPVFGKHYTLDMIDNILVIIIPLQGFHWGILVKSQENQLNNLINKVIPFSVNAFEKAILN